MFSLLGSFLSSLVEEKLWCRCLVEATCAVLVGFEVGGLGESVFDVGWSVGGLT